MPPIPTLKSRYIAPARSTQNPVTFGPDTTTFDVAPGGTIDVREHPYGEFLESNGWVWLCYAGETDERPIVPAQIRHDRGQVVYYADTDLNKVVAYDAKACCWRDPMTGAIA